MRSKVRSVSLPLLAAALMLFTLGVTAQAQTDEPGWLGVSIQDVTEELSQALPRGVHEGAMINRVVEGSPAEAAGLQEGDVVVKVGQNRVKNTGDLTKSVSDIGAGNTVIIEYYRDGRRMRTTAELTERSDEYDNAKNKYTDDAKRRYKKVQRLGKDDDGDHDFLFFDEHLGPMAWTHALLSDRPRLGVHLMDLNEQLAEYFKVSEDEGVLVTEVVEESAAEAAGIKAGDVIVSVGDEDMEDSDDIREALRAYRKGGEVSVGIVRNGRRQSIAVELEEVEEPNISAWTTPRSKVHIVPDVNDFYFDTDDFREDMEGLRKELDEMRRELEELRRERP
jgi:C-terminal processing protease CtpA/Prc